MDRLGQWWHRRAKMMYLRQMSGNDLDFAIDLTTTEGWSSTKRDFEELLEYDPMSCFIGEINAEPIGMVCTASYGKFGFIGNLIVSESCRGQECGYGLMKHAIEYLHAHNAQSILIDAVPRAETLYKRLGFRRLYRSLRLEGIVPSDVAKGVRRMMPEDISSVSALDASLFGGIREHFLKKRFEAFPELAKVLEIDGKIQGYIMGSKNDKSVRVGPWAMSKRYQQADQLLLGLAQSASKNPLKVGVLDKNRDALQILHRHGFNEVSFSWRMLWGEDTEATLSDGLYAIYSPDRG
jgi:ribosomal protein S18 acetylase RimI-like enzyme